jgi:spermidine synthase
MALILVFISGFTALVYQVLWMKQLGLLFGNTSHASAATLAAFFAGLAVGSWYWGRRTARMNNPLRGYAWLEFGIAAAAGLYFVILYAFHAIYPAVYQRVESEGLILLVKFGLALALVFPPALLMGGTIPVMGQYLIRGRGRFGTTAAALYGVNTLGAALGAFLAGFYLPLWLGFRATCLAAMALTATVGITAWLMSRDIAPPGNGPTTDEASTATPPAPPGHRMALSFVCFLSGFAFLALEVLWTRMFLQVLENSVYTFATILVIVLICLAIGAMLSSALARLNLSPMHVLATLAGLSGLAVAITPFVFMEVTDSLQILATRGSWSAYVMMIFKNGFLTLGVPALLAGMVFPYLMKAEQRYVRTVGASLGRLAAVNTIGAILGAMLCGFLFLGTLGMWHTFQALAAAYLIASLVMPVGFRSGGVAVRSIGIIGLLLAFTWLNPTDLPIVSTDPNRAADEKVLKVWEGSDSTVAVTRRQSNKSLTIRINSHYGLGSTEAFMQERLQNDIPLLIYPQTRSIFFLGMGTGITAGAALHERFDQVEQVVVCELSPYVIEAAEKYIANDTAAPQFRTTGKGFDFTSGLFEDPRVTILAEDGRHYLMATEQQFDMVNGDLFVPYRSGVGNLYTREHFQNVKDRLAPGGVFFQWIPLYQVTEFEFKVMARTMLEVFDQVTLWRLHHQPGDDIIAFVGHKDASPLPATDLDSRDEMHAAVAGATVGDLFRMAFPLNEQTILFFYCGNVTASASLFADYPLNTDDRPVIEYMAPRSYRQDPDEPLPWFVGPRLAELVDQMQKLCPPADDPLLADRSDADRRLPLAGHHFYQTRLWQMLGDPARSQAEWQSFLENWGQ